MVIDMNDARLETIEQIIQSGELRPSGQPRKPP
jgi:hypothetical protein